MKNRINYNTLLEYIKYNSPCLTGAIHDYLRIQWGIDKVSARSYAITKLVKLGLIERDEKSPNQLIRFLKGE